MALVLIGVPTYVLTLQGDAPMRSMALLQTSALTLLLVSGVLPDATADAGSQLRALKQFGGKHPTPEHTVSCNVASVLERPNAIVLAAQTCKE